jgi:hypothetical protein
MLDRRLALLALLACTKDGPVSEIVPDASTTDVVDVDVSAPGRPVPDDFIGFSVEWDQVGSYLGDGNGGVRPAVVTLLRAFADEGHVPGVRIGGNSEDVAWWKDANATRPDAVNIDIGPTQLSTLDALTRATGSQLVLGLNIRTADAANAALLVTAAQAAIAPGSIQAFALGNEPDSYFKEWDEYITRADAFRDGIVARVTGPAPKFQWPALANRFWLTQLDEKLAGEQGRIATVSTHVYPYTVCDNLAPPDPTNLLWDLATADIADRYAPHAKAAHDLGLHFRMDEMNSVSCGGAAGVSDVYASALWAADIVTALARVELDGVNFHTPGNHYATWVFDQNGAIEVRPVYYGLRLASLATAHHGRVVPVSIATAGRVRGFATLGDDGATRLLLIREDTSSGALRVRVGGSRASLVRMHAPSLDAPRGITLGGATYDATTDGSLVGSVRAEDVSRDGDAWPVSIGAYEAVVVTIVP